MKIVVEYDPIEQKITDDVGVDYFVVGAKFSQPTKTDDKPEAIRMLELGVTPEDLIKLKQEGII